MTMEQAIRTVIDALGNLDIKATKNNVTILNMSINMLEQVGAILEQNSAEKSDKAEKESEESENEEE